MRKLKKMLIDYINSWRRRLAQRRVRLGPSIVQTDFFGCKVMVRPHEDVGRAMVFDEFETADLRHFMGAIRSGDLVFDIGGNVGAYCLPIAKANPTAAVVAFEPIPLNAALVNTSRLLNRLANVEVVPKCVSDTSGYVEFSLAEDSAYSSMIDTHRKAEVEKFSCECVSLDDFCRGRGRTPEVVKIDVEGAELKVLQGALGVFAGPHKPRLALIELYDKNLLVFGTEIAEVVRTMEDWGYRAYVLIDGRKEAFVAAHHNVHYNVFFET